MPTYHAFQANIPQKGMNEPKIIRFFIPQSQLPKKRQAIAWSHAMREKLKKYDGIHGEPVVRLLNTYARIGQREYPVLPKARRAKAGDILKIRTHIPAK